MGQKKKPEINSFIYDQMISDKSSKIIQWVQKSLSTNDGGKTAYSVFSIKECNLILILNCIQNLS